MKYCNDYAALLDLYVDGELAAEEMVRVQEHLDGCPACRAYVDDALAIRAVFPDVEDTAVPDGFAEGVMAAIRTMPQTKAAPKKKTSIPWVKVVLPLAACCAIVILLQNGPLSARNESAADTAAPAAAYDMSTDTAAAESAAQAAPEKAPASMEEAETDAAASARAYNEDANWDALVGSFQPSAELEAVYGENQADAGGEPFSYTSDLTEAGKTDLAADGGLEEYADDAEAETSAEDAPAPTSIPAGGGTQSSPGVSETLPWDGASEKNGEETDPDAYDGPKLRLTAEEAGDLLAGYIPVSETETELRYLLTEEEYQALLDLLPEDIRLHAAVWSLGGAMIIVEK